MITHADRDATTTMLQIETEKGFVVELSGGHFMFVNGVYKRASSVRIRDTVQTRDGSDKVVQIRSVMKDGLFNPYTQSGTLMVNDVVTHCVSESFLDNWIAEEYVVHAWDRTVHIVRMIRKLWPSKWKRFHEKLQGKELSSEPPPELLYHFYAS